MLWFVCECSPVGSYIQGSSLYMEPLEIVKSFGDEVQWEVLRPLMVCCPKDYGLEIAWEHTLKNWALKKSKWEGPRFKGPLRCMVAIQKIHKRALEKKKKQLLPIPSIWFPNYNFSLRFTLMWCTDILRHQNYWDHHIGLEVSEVP